MHLSNKDVVVLYTEVNSLVPQVSWNVDRSGLLFEAMRSLLCLP